MTAVFDSPTNVAVPAPDHDVCESAQDPYTPAIEDHQAIGDLLGHLQAGILTANSWRELEDWLSQADIAFDLGELDAGQVEVLARQAIDVSRGVPEQ